MAGWNGSGVFTFPYSWQADAAAGIDILASRMDTQFSYVSSQGFGNTLTRDGQGQPSANLPMAGFKHTGAAVAVANGEYLVYQQVIGAALSVASLTTSGTITSGSTLTVTAGGLTVSAGTATFAGGVTVSGGGITVSTGAVALSPLSGNVSIAPVSGNVTILPTAGNVSIGATAGTLTISPNVGTMNKVVIGGTTPAAGTFTTLIANNGTTGSQVVNFSQFPATTGGTGTMTFPNGVIQKWGSGSTTAGSGSVSFAVAFPTGCDNVQLTITGGSGTADFNAIFTGSKTASGFNVYGAAAQSVGFDWFATGH